MAQAYPPEKPGVAGSHSLPTRSANESSYISDDDTAVPDADPTDTVAVLTERLQAWKHACGYLENYITATEKMQKAHFKEYEKVLKTINDPLKEGKHFDQSLGGIAGLFENMRSNTQGIANSHMETSKNLGGSVMPILTRLHAEIKSKSKELNSGSGKIAKAVAASKNETQKNIELLGQHTAAFDSAGGNVNANTDPYVIQRNTQHKLHKQVLEENNSRSDIIAVQKNFEVFEGHVVQVFQQALEQFLQFVGSQADRQKAMYADMVGTAQKIPPDFEWMNFLHRSGDALVDPSSAPREVKHISYANEHHAATKALIQGTLERKSRGMGGLGGYKSGFYSVTPSKFLHQFDSDDNFRKEPAPSLSLYLPDCSIGAVSDVKFNVKGKDASKGKVGSKLQMTHEFSFKAHTPSDAQEWHRIITQCAGSSTTSPPISTATSPISPHDSQLPAYEKQPAPLQTTDIPPEGASSDSAGIAGAGAAATPATPATAAASPGAGAGA